MLVNNKPINVMLDLDGVMVNLNQKIREVFGSDYNKIADKNYLWGVLGNIEHLFLNLEPMPYYKTLFSYLQSLERIGTIHLEILTSLPYSTNKLVTAREDKIAWVRKYLDPDIPINTVVGGTKKARYVTGKDSILIDDMPRNIEAWNTAGGTGILYLNNADTIARLDNILTEIN